MKFQSAAHETSVHIFILSLSVYQLLHTKATFTMSSSSQARAQELNAKMEREARGMLDGVEKQYVRTVAKNSYKCVVGCFDTAGSTGQAEVLDHCSKNCQVKYQNANAIMQNVSYYC